MADPAVAEPTPSPAAPVGDPPADPPKAADPTPSDPPADPAAEPASAKPPGEDPSEGKSAEAKAPEKYDFSALKMPEGVALNDSIMQAVEPILRKLDLSQEEAAELVTAHAEAAAKAGKEAEAQREKEFVDFMAKKTTEYKEAVRKAWGSEYEPNLATAQRAIARYLDDEAKAILADTGLGNHPAFLRAFLQIGKSVTEDMPPLNGGVPPSGDARIFYPNSQHN